MAREAFDPRVDAYIEKAQPFARPILEHLRALMHKGCPGVEEAIKWSMPFFVYKGAILANIAGFKKHCSLGFWGREIGAILRQAGEVRSEGMGTLGRIAGVNDLPSDKQLLAWIRQAAAFVDSGAYTSPMAGRNKVVKAPKPALKTPPAFAAALKKNRKAAAAFDAFSPGCKREYIEWIADAKRDETRNKRIATAVQWIADGKRRNWKYQA